MAASDKNDVPDAGSSHHDRMPAVEIWGCAGSPECNEAIDIANAMGLPYTYIEINSEERRQAFLRKTNGAPTVPQIVLDGRHLGGAAAFQAWARTRTDVPVRRSKDEKPAARPKDVPA